MVDVVSDTRLWFRFGGTSLLTGISQEPKQTESLQRSPRGPMSEAGSGLKILRRRQPYPVVSGGCANNEPIELDFDDLYFPSYQRELVSSHAKILAEYKSGLAGVLTVGNGDSWSKADKYAVIDGRQRMEAMRKRGYTSAWCSVIETESLEHEVLLFLEANETRSSVSTTDRHVAKLIAHQQPNEDIEGAAQRAGVCFDRRKSKRYPLLDSIGQVQAVFRWGMEKCNVPQADMVKGLETALGAANAAWRPPTLTVQRGRGKWITGNAVAGLTLLCTRYANDFDVHELADVLKRVKLEEVEKNFGAEHPHLIRARNATAWRLWLLYFQHYPNGDLRNKGRRKSPVQALCPDVMNWAENLVQNKVL